MSKSYWIWYPGDFELYHGMKQNFSRVERGFGWPAFWKSEGFRNRVAFRRTYHLEEETSFTVYSNAIGHVLAGENQYPFGKKRDIHQFFFGNEADLVFHCLEIYEDIRI